MESLPLTTERLLGSGAMGSVYLTRDHRGEGHALKVLGQPNPEGLRHLEQEVSLLAKLEHPRLVRVEGFSAEGLDIPGLGKGPCFWMEYVSGRPLLEAATGAGPAQILQWFRESLAALAYLHHQGILHGDIKPANVLVDGESHVKLVDFGLAGLLEDLNGPSGRARGSIPYMAPEVLNGRPLPASDLYSLGTLFYQALAGRHPREGAKNLKELFLPQVPKLQTSVGLSSAEARVIERLIEPDLAKRLKTTGETLQALEQEELPVPTGGENFHSFKMFGVEEPWQQAETFVAQMEERDQAGVLIIHGLTGVGKSRFLRELSFDLALKGHGVHRIVRPSDLEQVLAEPKQRAPASGPKIPIHILAAAEAWRPQALRSAFTFLRSPDSRGVLVLEFNDENLSETQKNLLLTLRLEKNTCPIELRNLNRQNTEAFLQFCLRPDLPPTWIRVLYERSSGNPKLLTELCREILASGILQKKHLGGESLAQLELPHSARDLFQKRVNQLENSARPLLNYLALHPGFVDTNALASLIGKNFSALQSGLEILARWDLIQTQSPGSFNRIKISHSTLSEIIGEQLSDGEKVRIHQSWHDFLMTKKQNRKFFSDEEAYALAWHGMHIPGCPGLFTQVEVAGKGLLEAENPNRALALYEECLPLLGEPGERETLLRLIINVYGRLGRHRDSLQGLQKWYEEYVRGKNGLNQVKYHMASGVAFQNLNQYPKAREEFLRAIAAGGAEDPEQRALMARGFSLLGLLDILEEAFPAAKTNFAKALELLEPKSIATAEVFKHRALLAVHLDQWHEAQKNLDLAEALYRDLQHDPGLFSVALERGNLALQMGKIAEANAAYQKASELAKKRKDEANLARVFQNLGVLACRQGNFDAALDYLEKAREVLSFVAYPLELGINLLQLALAYAGAGRFQKCNQVLELIGKQSHSSEDFHKRRREIEFLIHLYRYGSPATQNGNPWSAQKDNVPADWDLEMRLVRELSLKPKPDPEAVKLILQQIHEGLSDAVKLTFEDRGDYRRWVLGETIETPDFPPLTQGKSTMNILEKIAEITKAILSATDIDEVLVKLMDAAMEISHAKHGFLLLKNPEANKPIPGFEVRVARNMNQKEIENDGFSVSVSALKEAIESGNPLVTDNALQDSRFETAASVHQMELKSICALPLRDSDEIIGALYLDHPYQTDIFQETDLNVLQMLTDQAALALQKAQMILKLQDSNVALSHTVEDQAQEITILKREVEDHRVQLKHEYKDIIGQSPAMLEVLSLVDRVTETKVPVWVYGESGTGKEMIARALHFNSSRAKAPFVSENCSALPETLLESELFGHKRGAFTHADRDKKGILEYADKGTIFLDEIADMSLAMQAKLLRFLQEGEIRPLGSNKVLKVDVRVVSASNKDLPTMVQEEKFREDLFYRLNGVTVTLPPLRDRMEDIPLLAQHFLKKIGKEEGRSELEVAPDALNVLMEYNWPGNVRELENTLRTAILFSQKGRITAKSLQFKKNLGATPASRPSRSATSPKVTAPPADDLSEEKRLLLKALFDSGYHKGNAAKILGISRRYLYTQLLRHQVPVGRIEMKSYIEKHLGNS